MTALEHLEHAMPGVLAAPDACDVIDGLMVTHFRFEQTRPVHELDDTCPCADRRNP